MFIIPPYVVLIMRQVWQPFVPVNLPRFAEGHCFLIVRLGFFIFIFKKFLAMPQRLHMITAYRSGILNSIAFRLPAYLDPFFLTVSFYSVIKAGIRLPISSVATTFRAALVYPLILGSFIFFTHNNCPYGRLERSRQVVLATGLKILLGRLKTAVFFLPFFYPYSIIQGFFLPLFYPGAQHHATLPIEKYYVIISNYLILTQCATSCNKPYAGFLILVSDVRVVSGAPYKSRGSAKSGWTP